MKICWVGYLSKNHSWSVVAQNISRSLIALGHQVDLYSTNGIEYFPDDLKPYLIGFNNEGKEFNGKLPDLNYDACFSYTTIKNFPRYLKHSQKNRFGIWTYEFAGKNSLPIGFAKNHIFCDKLLAPSSFAKQIFTESGVPEYKVPIIPHGINLTEIEKAQSFSFKTKKSIKILINLGQIHRRKNLEGALEIFGRAFSKKDDVCLILKIVNKPITQRFELSFNKIYHNFQQQFPNHAETEIITDFIPNIYSVYKSCDINFTASNCEAFGMPQLESLACGLINVASNYGGYLDFLNESNSYLINGKLFQVSPDYLYYQNKYGLLAFKPDIDDGVDKLKTAVAQCAFKKEQIKQQQSDILNNFNWVKLTENVLKFT